MGNQQSQVPRVQDLAPDPFAPNPAIAVNLNRSQLIRLLTWMGQYIQRNSPSRLTLVVVGGAVNVILLQSRPATHDIDWFCPNLSRKESDILYKAYYDAVKKAKAERLALPEKWFNNQTMLFIQPDLRQMLYSDAKAQNCVVFEAGGLKLLAAPWQYAFISKLDRIIGGTWKEHDPNDAATYLHQYLERRNARRIEVQAIESLIHIYRNRRLVDMTSLHIVDETHQRIYGASVIRFDTQK